MIREDRYLVFKRADMAQGLTDVDRDTILAIAKKLSNWRALKGKEKLACVVVESDWPEYEPTWNAIEERVKNVNARFDG